MNQMARRPELLGHDVVMLAFESSKDCIKLLDLNGTLLALNAGGAATMGFEHPDVPVGRDWIQFWQGQERDMAQAAVEAARNGETSVMRGYLPTAAGHPRWWSSTVIPVSGGDGSPTRLLVISKDITEQRLAEEEVGRSERLWRKLVEATSEIVWVQDACTKEIRWQGWMDFTGHPTDPADAQAWSDSIHPDDRTRVGRANRDAMDRGTPLLAEYRLPSRGGQWRWVQEHAVSQADEDGRREGWVGVITDIHDRKVAEQALILNEARLRMALDSASLGTWDVDLLTGERNWSLEAKRIIGVPDASEVTDVTWLDYVHPDDRERVVELRRVNMGQRSGTTLVEFRVVRPDSGEIRWIAARGRVLLDDDGLPVRRVGTFADFTEHRRMQDELSSTLRRHEAFVAATSVGTWHSDASQSRCERLGWNEFTGGCLDDTGSTWLAIVHPDDRRRASEVRDQAMEGGQAYSNRYRLKHIADGWRWVSDDVVPLLNDEGQLDGWMGVMTDVHDRHVAEQALRTSEERLRIAIESTGLGIWDVDMASDEREWSPEFYGLLRLPVSTLPTQNRFLDRIHPDDRTRVLCELDGSDGLDGRAQVSTFRLCLDDGAERWMEVRERTFFDAEHRPTRRVGTMQDVTDRKQAEREIWTAAHTDALTGVANRTLFQTRLDGAVADAGARAASVGLLLIDLDRFKEVNDTLGHDAGDAVLCAMASRLREHVPAGATVARLGGDEFGVVLPISPGTAQPASVAAGLLDELRRPVVHEGREVDCSVTIGWSAYPWHDADASSLLKNADIALYAAKRAGRGRSAAFAPAMRDSMRRHVNVLRIAKDALARDAVMPFYQPKVRISTREIVGFEALLRWTDETGVRPPAAILEAFQDPELAVRLGSRMLDRVTADMRGWTASSVPFGRIALNVAAPEFHGSHYSEHILGSLAASRIRPEQFEIEVTEGVLLDDGTATIAAALRALHDVGVAIALDDFGTGYASLTHLKSFPVSWLKLDRSFVGKVEEDPDAAAIVKAVIGLAHTIGIKVVAEGIESQGQLKFLTEARCDLGQGYLFAKPMHAAEVPSFITRWLHPQHK